MRDVFLSVAAFEFGNVAATLLLLRVITLFRPGSGSTGAVELGVLLYAGFIVSSRVTVSPARRLIDRNGPVLALAAGVLLFLLSYLGFALTDANLLLVALCFIAAGLGSGAVIATEAMLLEDIVDDHLRPATEGLLGVVRAVGNFTASAVTGILWSVVSVRAARLYLGGWMVISLVGLALASRNGGSPTTAAATRMVG